MPEMATRTFFACFALLVYTANGSWTTEQQERLKLLQCIAAICAFRRKGDLRGQWLTNTYSVHCTVMYFKQKTKLIPGPCVVISVKQIKMSGVGMSSTELVLIVGVQDTAITEQQNLK